MQLNTNVWCRFIHKMLLASSVCSVDDGSTTRRVGNFFSFKLKMRMLFLVVMPFGESKTIIGRCALVVFL